MIKCAIFDLDGTLVNTIDDLGLACDYLLKKSGIEPKWTTQDYTNFVGNGAKLLVKRAFENKLSEEELNKQYEMFKVKYEEIKLDHAYVYEGIKELISALKQKGVKLAVCTNKPNLSAQGMVVKYFGEDVFDFVQGAVDGVPRKPEPDSGLKIINALDVTLDECVFIGDSNVDIETAKNLGVHSIGVTWGFRDYDNLKNAGAEHIVDTPKKILEIL